MNRREDVKFEKLKVVYREFHVKMKNIIKRQSELIEKIAKFSDNIKIEAVREKIKNLLVNPFPW